MSFSEVFARRLNKCGHVSRMNIRCVVFIIISINVLLLVPVARFSNYKYTFTTADTSVQINPSGGNTSRTQNHIGLGSTDNSSRMQALLLMSATFNVC